MYTESELTNDFLVQITLNFNTVKGLNKLGYKC